MASVVSVAGFLEALGEVGEQLLLPAHDAIHLEDAWLGFGVANLRLESGISGDEEEGRLLDDVRDQESSEEVAVHGAMLIECCGDLGLAFPERIESEFLDLGDGEAHAGLGVFLAIGLDGFGGGFGGEDGTGAEELLDKFAGVDAGDVFEDGEGIGVATCGGGRREIEGVRDETGEKGAGDGRWQFDAVGEELLGDDGAGRSDGFVAEQDGLLRGEGAEAVVIDDFDDLDFAGALDGLGEFVVIDEDELAIHFPEEVGFGEDSDDAILVIDDRERLELGGGGETLGGGEMFV